MSDFKQYWTQQDRQRYRSCSKATLITLLVSRDNQIIQLKEAKGKLEERLHDE